MRRHGQWLLSEQAFESGILDMPVEIDSAAAVAFFEDREAASVPMTVVDGVANIPIVGVITKEPDFIFSILGGGNPTYMDIVDAVHAAEGDDAVKSIALRIDSPGGTVAGFVEAATAIMDAKKPVHAFVSDMAASGAFGLAAAADTITVNNPMAQVGSVGVVISATLDGDGMMSFRSTEAPLKNQPNTDEGRAAIVSQLDDLHKVFAGFIAKGRNLDLAKVNTDFGRGALVIAKDALTRGMIDSIGEKSDAGSGLSAAQKRNNRGAKAMTLDEFKAEHPTVYAAAFDAGNDAGAKAEQSRCAAHLKVGEACGDMSIATGFIADGTPYGDPLASAAYDAARMNKGTIADRAGDDDAAAAAAAAAGASASGGGSPAGGGASDKDSKDKFQAAVVAKLRGNLGLAASAGV